MNNFRRRVAGLSEPKPDNYYTIFDYNSLIAGAINFNFYTYTIPISLSASSSNYYYAIMNEPIMEISGTFNTYSTINTQNGTLILELVDQKNESHTIYSKWDNSRQGYYSVLRIQKYGTFVEMNMYYGELNNYTYNGVTWYVQPLYSYGTATFSNGEAAIPFLYYYIDNDGYMVLDYLRNSENLCLYYIIDSDYTQVRFEWR